MQYFQSGPKIEVLQYILIDRYIQFTKSGPKTTTTTGKIIITQCTVSIKLVMKYVATMKKRLMET